MDILIKRTATGITTSVYRKSTHSGVYTHYSSFVPFRLKRRLINTLLFRAYELCSNYELLHREFENLKTMFMNNGYQRDFILSVIKEFLSTKIQGKSTSKLEPGQKEPKNIFIRLPYLQDTSHKAFKSLNSCLSRIKCSSELTFKVLYKYCRIGNRLRFKDKQTIKSNCVYRVKCMSCDASYIGETCRNVNTRMREHSTCKDSAVFDHTRETGHEFNLKDPEILCFESDWSKRKIKEALYIQEHNPSLNKQVESFKLFLFSVPQWYSN